MTSRSVASPPLGVGIVGFGLMGRRYARVLDQAGEAYLAGVADVSAEARAEAAREHGCPGLPDVAALLATPGVDAVIIALPDHLHRDAALAAIRAGRHVLIEKPLATDVADAGAIVREAARSDRVIMAGHLLRFDPRYRTARDLIRDRLGPVLHIATRRNSARSGLRRYGATTSLAYHVATHDLDLIAWLTGQRICRVFAQAAPAEGPHASLLAQLTLESGAIAAVECSWALPESMGSGLDARLNAVCVSGAVEVSGLHGGLLTHELAGSGFPDALRYAVTGEDALVGGLLRDETLAFVRAARLGLPTPVPVAAGLAAVVAAAAIEESVRTSGVVEIG